MTENNESNMPIRVAIRKITEDKPISSAKDYLDNLYKIETVELPSGAIVKVRALYGARKTMLLTQIGGIEPGAESDRFNEILDLAKIYSPHILVEPKIHVDGEDTCPPNKIPIEAVDVIDLIALLMHGAEVDVEKAMEVAMANSFRSIDSGSPDGEGS